MKRVFWIALILCLIVYGQSMAQDHGPDYEGDTDVDGLDLGEYAKRIQLGTTTMIMGQFALNFGEINYFVINDFTQYYSSERLLRFGKDIFEEINTTTLATSGEVISSCEEELLPGDPLTRQFECTFYREIIDGTGEPQLIPIGINALRYHMYCVDWDDLGAVDILYTSSVTLASGRVVNRTDFSKYGQTVRLDGTPFDFEQWYGNEVPLGGAPSWCDENYPGSGGLLPGCTEDLWAVSSYNDPITKVIGKRYLNGIGPASWCGSDLKVEAYGDSIDLSYPEILWDGAKTVFVTRETYTADGFGGLDGAGAICNAEAQAAGLEGAFGALLSGIYYCYGPGIDDPPGCLPLDVHYTLPDGTKVMRSLKEAEAAGLLSPINMDAFGQTVSGKVWTGTYSNGSRACLTTLPSCFTCGSYESRDDDWTYSDIGLGMTGSTEASDGRWLEDQTVTCGQEAALYCFEK